MIRQSGPLAGIFIVYGIVVAQPSPVPDWAKGSELALGLNDPRNEIALVFSDPSVWKFTSTDAGKGFLELHYDRKNYKSPYVPKHRSPIHIALLRDFNLSDFVMDIEVMSTTELYNHQDACLYFGFQNPTHFYYVHLAPVPDANAHNIFIVNDAPRKNLLEPQKKGITWKKDAWHTLRLLRQASTGKIEVYFDDMTSPVLTTTDKTFTYGFIGFGSFDDTARFRNLRIHTKAMSAGKKADFFEPLGK